MTAADGVRHSKAADAELISDPELRAVREASNAILQAERVRQYALEAIDQGRGFKLRPSKILDLNRCAISGLDAYAGVWRPGTVEIEKSGHSPPGAHLVPEFVEELCDYINDNWESCTPVHLSSMVMWRLNWIHPFTDGNGRTSRATAYLVLCAKSGSWLPGSDANTITDQILKSRGLYYAALEAADAAYDADRALRRGTVAKMEELIAAMLAAQLTGYFKAASGE